MTKLVVQIVCVYFMKKKSENYTFEIHTQSISYINEIMGQIWLSLKKHRISRKIQKMEKHNFTYVTLSEAGVLDSSKTGKLTCNTILVASPRTKIAV